MSWTERMLWHRLKRSGATINTTGEISQQESLESLTTTATFSPAGRPSLTPSDEVTIEWVDLEANVTRYQFAGTIAATDTESHPAATEVPCQGVLASLANARKTSDGDLLLTGMTDGEVIQTVLTYCGIDFDPDDIDEAGYVLGGLADPMDPEDSANLWWRANDPGSMITDEMDDVFFFKLFEVSGGRVIRRYYDSAPDDTGLYRTYRRSTSRDLFSVRRRLGLVSEITNSFRVQGFEMECGPDGACSCQVWAKAYDSNPRLGGRSGLGKPHTVRPDYQSDIIQDENLAEWRVRQMMRRNNRVPDTITFSALNDPNMHPCSVIALVDPTTYIDANPRYYTLTSLDRAGHIMTGQAIGGEAGDEGTVTVGVEKLCNDSEGTDTWPGTDIDPTVGFPPIDDGIGFDEIFPIDGWSEVVTEPSLSTPFTDCTEADGMAGGSDWIAGDGYTLISNLDDINWRSAGASTSALMHGFGVPPVYTIQELVMWGGGAADIYWNETVPYASKNAPNDVKIPTAPAFSVSFEVWFGDDDADLQIHLGGGRAILYPAPGSDDGNGHSITADLSTENESAYDAGGLAEHTCTNTSIARNNGGFRRGGGLPLNQWIPVVISFDYTGLPQHVYYAGPDGGYILDTLTCSPDTGFAYDPCDDVSHDFRFQGFTTGSSTTADPSVKLRGISIGHDTCVVNDDFDPDTLPDYDGSDTVLDEVPDD